jgi:hypothetical protein
MKNLICTAGDQSEDEMGSSCGTYGAKDAYIEGFDGDT